MFDKEKEIAFPLKVIFLYFSGQKSRFVKYFPILGSSVGTHIHVEPKSSLQSPVKELFLIKQNLRFGLVLDGWTV